MEQAARSIRTPARTAPAREGGDGRSLETFFAAHRRPLLGFLYRRLGSREEAEDAVGLTFCKAWRARDSLRDVACPKAWLYRIAERVALDAVRRRRRRPCELELPPAWADGPSPLDPELPDPASVLVEAERGARTAGLVREAVGRLCREDRQLVRLFYFEARSYDEIGRLTGLAQSQVRGRLHRIRARMRRDLAWRDWEG